MPMTEKLARASLDHPPTKPIRHLLGPVFLGPVVGGLGGGLAGLACGTLHALLTGSIALFTMWEIRGPFAGLSAGAIMGVCLAIDRATRHQSIQVPCGGQLTIRTTRGSRSIGSANGAASQSRSQESGVRNLGDGPGPGRPTGGPDS